MDHSWTLERIGELGLLAVVRGESRTTALEVAAALVEGGVLGIEVTFTTPEAGKVMEDLNVGVPLNIGGCHFAGAFLVDSQRLRFAAVQLKRYLFEIENNVGGVFHHPFNR